MVPLQKAGRQAGRQATTELLTGLEITAMARSCCNGGALREHLRKGSIYWGESKQLSREVVVFELRLEG